MTAHRIQVLALAAVAALTTTRVPLAAAATSSDGVWREVPRASTAAAGDGARATAGRRFVVQLDRLRAQLDGAPPESRDPGACAEVHLPLPDGRFARVRAVDSPVLGEALRRAHPEFRTFRAVGADDPRIQARLDLTPLGTHAIVFTPEGTAWIDPVDARHPDVVTSAWTRDQDLGPIDCEVIERATSAVAATVSPTGSWGSQLRTLRFVLMATGEYTQAVGDVPSATARMVTVMNRVNAAFERDIAVHLEVVQIHPFPDPATDPYDWSNYLDLLPRNTVVADSLFGTDSYDMGGILTVIFGNTRGVGYLPTLCGVEDTKAGSVVATGNPFDTSSELTLGHELGHGLGGSHTQDRGCNRSSTSAYEAGSGLTILCSMPAACPADVQPTREPFYHIATIEQMITTLPAHPDCGTTTTTGNTPPTSDAGPDYTIPRGTPFVLRGNGSDPDAGDALTYTWEQFDLAPAPFDPVLGPIYRWRLPTSQPVRYCPPTSVVLTGVPETYEPLVPVDRTLHFRLTVRDNHPAAGGVAWDEMVITVQGAPFAVTAPNGGEALTSAVPFPVTWTVGGGSVAALVNILVSTDGGHTWSPALMGTPNDGSELVFFPVATTQTSCRVKVEAVGNIFYDVSNGDFTLQPAVTATQLAVFEAEGTAEGIAVRWQFSNPGDVVSVAVERSETGASWSEVEGTRHVEGAITVFVDATAEAGRAYQYRLVASLATGGEQVFGPISAQLPALPRTLAIEYASPSPARGPLRIAYATPRAGRVRVDVVDVQGRVVAVVREGDEPAGRHEVEWSGRGARGRAAGLYYVRLSLAGEHRVRAVTFTD